MKRKCIALLLPIVLCFSAPGYGGENAFSVTAQLQPADTGETQLVVRITIPPENKVYADQFQIKVPKPAKIVPLALPVPQNEKDVFSGEIKPVYDQTFEAVFLVENLPTNSIDVTVYFQRCDKNTCFLPDSKKFHLQTTGRQAELRVNTSQANLPHDALPRWLNNIRQNYHVAAVHSGYMDARQFVNFLDRPASDGIEINPIQKTWRLGMVWLTVFMIIAGGLALNLTPCVLPLIPVNLAIIGAGSQADSPWRGFLLGTLYGFGIILAYGSLGLLTVLTGAQFGSINASPWFNLGVALLFLILALAIMDRIMIDFSRFQNRLRFDGKGLSFVVLLGAISALLAGACVAPVVIAVLLLATDLHSKGHVLGLLLPFLLGVGMALPWPFAGAGLSFLPKPGRWMLHIKRVFAAIMLLAALYYGTVGVKLLYHRYQARAGKPETREQTAGHWLDSFPVELTREAGNKPVLIYFWAGWCKSCNIMSATTFNDPTVRQKMDNFVCIKFQAEDTQDAETATVLREFGVLGLPTFVILQSNQ